MESEQQVLLPNLFGFQFWELICVDGHDKLAQSDNRVELEDKQILLIGDASIYYTEISNLEKFAYAQLWLLADFQYKLTILKITWATKVNLTPRSIDPTPVYRTINQGEDQVKTNIPEYLCIFIIS